MEIKIGSFDVSSNHTVGFVCLCLLLIFAGIIIGNLIGIENGKQRMATVCNVMEKNAGCSFTCYSDGCICDENT